MFNRHEKKETTAQRQAINFTMVTSPDHILAEEKRAALVTQIQQISILSLPRFEQLGRSVLVGLINYCQLLPETANSYYAQPGGLIDHALNRTEAALTLFRQFLLQDIPGEYSEEQKLWQYALYTAAMLQGIGKLQIDFTIKRYDKNKSYIADWNPLLGALVTDTAYYDYAFEKEAEVAFRCRLNLLLARRLMPEAGFAWIASNPQVLATWLALLNEDYYSAGTLGAILIRADAIALRRYFTQLIGHDQGGRPVRHRVSTFAGGVPESIENLTGKVGAEFIQWLYEALDSGKMIFNKQPLLFVPGGLLMSPEIFKWFMKEHPEYKNWLAIQTGFLSLGLHRVGADGETAFRFEKSGEKAMQEGIVLENYAVVLPDKVQVQQKQAGQSTTMTAMDIIHQADKLDQLSVSAGATAMMHLSAKGQWQPAPAVDQGLIAGMKQRG